MAEDTINALPCIVCGGALIGCSTPNQPLDALAFSTSGHYGTTLFDPMDGSALEINVCDPCLAKAGAAGRVLHYREPKNIQRDPEPWSAALSGDPQ